MGLAIPLKKFGSVGGGVLTFAHAPLAGQWRGRAAVKPKLAGVKLTLSFALILASLH
jgi:hypothetical protein